MSGGSQGYQTSGVNYGAPNFQPTYAGQNGFQAYNGYTPTMGYQGSTPQGTYQPYPTFSPTFNFGGYPSVSGGYGAPPGASNTGMQNMGSGASIPGTEVNGSSAGGGVYPTQMNNPLARFPGAGTETPGPTPSNGMIYPHTAPSVLPGSQPYLLNGPYGNQPGQNGLVFTNGQFGFGNGSIAQIAPGTAAMLGFRNNGQGQWVNAQGQVVGSV